MYILCIFPKVTKNDLVLGLEVLGLLASLCSASSERECAEDRSVCVHTRVQMCVHLQRENAEKQHSLPRGRESPSQSLETSLSLVDTQLAFLSLENRKTSEMLLQCKAQDRQQKHRVKGKCRQLS